MNWYNFIVTTKYAYGTDGHLPSTELMKRIQAHHGGPAYHCAFNLEKRDTYNSYQGKLSPTLGRIWFDFDGPNALEDLRKFLTWLGTADFVVYFSGSKGFHVGLSHVHLPMPFDEFYNRKLGELAHKLKAIYPTLDTTVYNASRKFRLDGSKHEKTGLFKTLLYDSWKTLEMDDVRALGHIHRTVQDVEVPLSAGPAPISELVAFAKECLEKKYTVMSEEMDASLLGKMKMHPKKICIKRMAEEIAPLGHKHQVGLRLISDWKSTNLPLQEAGKRLKKWGEIHGLDSKQFDDIEAVLQGVYAGEAYSFGCNDEYKAAKCSGKCELYKFLKPETRPTVLDAPAKLTKKEEDLPSEVEIAETLLEKFGPTMLREQECLFQYRSGVWVEVCKFQIDKLKVMIMELYENESDSYKVDSTFRTFFRMLPGIPPDKTLFVPRSDVVNFLNGTLHVTKSGAREFRVHDPLDFITNQLPIEYDPIDTTIHPDVLAIFERVFGPDPDKDEKIRAVKQMFGFCLVPKFPHIVLLVGPPGSGKSTFLDFASALVGEENISSVGPHEMGQRFGLWPMVGKLVNFVYDIDTHKRIADSKIKMIRDHTTVHIERKGIAHVRGKIPAAHIWAGNAVPPTADESGAHLFRWTFIEMKAQLRTGSEDLNFSKNILAKHMRSILNLALEGLDDLLQSGGRFIQPGSGHEIMAEFLDSADDPVRDFLRDIEAGRNVDVNTQIKKDDAGRIASPLLWENFKVWYELNNNRNREMGRTRFYAALRRHGLQVGHHRDGQFVSGFAQSESPNGSY